ncbi:MULTISPECIES: glycerol-3-phosphate responsive antiterminator [unclassified Paenibacillus]|uniref:glycerol-3-phosphate responsive antiterminator n=1 Tax=unclassified Paenibacillus TaxID=185978 RepID=UPI000956E0BD|nr:MULTISPECIES: glycerol-3-phosphate responsive antiterminator [unclassified Paenibacillus]ASS68624.1 glycerol-3-phosphate responsive antiterminator [Paenibacillus sp. RUD330]SIR64896.1 glycerol uptake operon antiterminator [Paenibacillus sp. RU4X]SIR72839.1 glycerol uptake operon antiterminator [Paenibacillus sp. RU4T]
MAFKGQLILPAIRKPKDLEKLMGFSYEYMVLLDSHISQLKPILDLARSGGKQLLIHADLIEGLKNDEYAAEFLCQVMRPAGILSTRASVIAKTKQNGLLAIQRVFLLDSGALNKSYALLERSQPDYIEVLPGVIPDVIAEVKDRTGIPIFAGGLIRSVWDVEKAAAAGAAAVTTSRVELWKHFDRKDDAAAPKPD